ncbi:MAG: hypothetical protein GY795_27145 [Desulfobacterales bacterium]|nr:hypothetical protein [Desulfobacterales bacterium]
MQKFIVLFVVLICNYTGVAVAQMSYLSFEGTCQTEDKQSILKIKKIDNTERQYSLSGSIKGKNFSWSGAGILGLIDEHTFLGITGYDRTRNFDYLIIKHKPSGLIKYKIAKKSDDLGGNENFTDWFRIGD